MLFRVMFFANRKVYSAIFLCQPKNTGSDGSDMEFDSVKRKSARLSKKPKILDEYVITSSQEDSSSQFSQLQETPVVVDSIRVLSKEKSTNNFKLVER